MADLKQMIAQAVQKHGLPPEYADMGYRQMMAESSGNPNAIGPKTRTGERAQGLMQFMPATAKSYGLQNPNDPVQSVDAWARMTKDLIKQTGGNPAHVLAAYNWGIGNLNKHGMGKMPAETRDYIQKIMGGMPVGGRVAELAPQKPYTPAVQSSGAQDVQEALAKANNPVQGDAMEPQQQVAQAPVYSPEDAWATGLRA